MFPQDPRGAEGAAEKIGSGAPEICGNRTSQQRWAKKKEEKYARRRGRRGKFGIVDQRFLNKCKIENQSIWIFPD